MLPVAFDEGFGYEMFVDWAMRDMPLMCIYKGNTFLDAHGAPFQDYIDGKLDIAPGQKATLPDWQNHLNTIWSEVRLRRFLEMRGADNGPSEMIKALPALWVGLLYDQQALNDAYEMVRHWTHEDREYLRDQTPKTGLQTPFLGTTVQDIAKNMLSLSEAGLRRRGVLDAKGNDESLYLEPLHEIAHSGLNWSQRLRQRLNGEWNGDLRRVFDAMSYANAPSVLAAAPAAQVSATAARRARFKAD
jgi:glutamate--cysteine ligase